jgi:hypothetical protein
MAHPSNSFPKELYVSDGTNDIPAPTGRHFFAIYNATSAAGTVDVTGTLYTYQTDAYKESSAEKTGLSIPPGGTLYGRFTNVDAPANFLAYLA